MWLAWEAAQLMARPGSNTFLPLSLTQARPAPAYVPLPLRFTRPSRGPGILCGRGARPASTSASTRTSREGHHATLRYALLGDVLLGD